jgi:xylulokinase
MTESDLLLGLDIGTQGVKGALVTADGRVVARGQVEHDCTYPRPGWCEQDMRRNWWENPVRVIRCLLVAPGIDPARIGAIGICGLYPALGPTDAEGAPIAGAILYSDNRALAEVDEINRAQGLKLTSEELTPKLLWFLRHQPELASRMRMFFDAAHYAVYKLTGAYVIDTITVGLFGAIHSAPTASWREAACERFQIPLSILPSVEPPARIIGTVHEAAAEATGLLRGTPVLTGMPDLVASIVSAGATRADEAVAYYGTAGLVPVLKDDLLHALWHPFPEEDGYLFDYPAYSLAVGDAVRWFRDQFGGLEIEAEAGGTGPSAYARLDALAQEIPPGSEGLFLLPYFQGQRTPDFDPAATGVFFGVRKSHTRAHFFRAVLESFGYSIRHGLEACFPGGVPLRRLVATGGGARSPLWRQIVSDITGLQQEYVPEADGPIGAAYVAGLAIGWFRDFELLQRDWVERSDSTAPDREVKGVYDLLYPFYRDLHEWLRQAYAVHHRLVRAPGASGCSDGGEDA